ncbi:MULTISPECIES: DUF6883 domain-containing protein [Cupriavidus]
MSYSDDPARQALTVGLATLIGGVVGALLGTDATSAALAAQNASLNNATSHGPARSALAQENARLTKQCEPNCTTADFDRIDKEVRTLEANLALARMNNLTPEQTLKLADTLSNLLPYYGSAAMLYPAVTGQTLSGQELGTADRWLSGILGAIPAGAAAYGKISEFVATKGIGAKGVSSSVGAVADTRHFSDYIFKSGADHGKDTVFKSLGYTADDSVALSKVWQQQAAEKYAAGEFKLGRADQYGQRVDIEIALPGKGQEVGKISYLRSGWMIQPDGSLKLNTPFSGFTRSQK